MKKILIMVMSCEDLFFKEQENIAKKTWLSKIKDYDNIDYCFYTGKTIDKHKYIKDEHKLILSCEDNIDNTFKKTYYAFNIIDKLFEYDYVFRTNTSTYVNIDLLNAFIQQLDNDEVLWTSELYASANAFCPYPTYIYGRGNGLIMSKKIINILKKYGTPFIYLEKCDDWMIGNILNTYWINEGKNYLDYIKGYKHGWFKCISVNNIAESKYTNWNNTNKDWNFLNQFITIQIKRYNERHLENSNYNEIHEVFENNKYSKKELNKIVKLNLEYSENPQVFIGYIKEFPKYIDFNEYKKYDLIDLYNYQSDNKPFWDKQNTKKIINII